MGHFGASRSEGQNPRNFGNFGNSVTSDFHDFGNFGANNYFRMDREVFKKHPGAGSSVLPEYEPVASHRDPV